MTLDNMAPDNTAQWRMPGEWAPHEGCLMAWPTRRDLWNHHLDAAKREYAAVAAAIAEFEPVTMIVAPGDRDGADSFLGGCAAIVELAIDDSWIRDSGPIFALDAGGGQQRIGVDFGFNSWGEKFAPWDLDATIARRLLEHRGEYRQASSMVLEGGSITVDGAGTLITTEQCVLHPSRNPDLSRDDIERELRDTLGIDTVIWLPWGLIEDTHTDGHVDNVCAFVRPGVVITQSCTDKANPNHERMAANLDVLRSAVDASGKRFDVIEVPQHSFFDIDGDPYRTSYLNFYIANGGVIVPTAGHPNDAAALDIIAEAFPERKVVAVESRTLAYGGGGIHCITQQIPSAESIGERSEE